MCGISGFRNDNSLFSKDDLSEMTNILINRGPDAAGLYYDQKTGIGLGHRRLSILDVSTSANQPFYSKCKNYVIIFNGEIYNFRELAAKYNLSLTTTGDTEVIIELYAKFGKECVQEFNGMFAFAIYNISNQELFLCRDRLGVKPLFLYKQDDTIAFSSEIKGLIANKNIKKNLTVNNEAIRLFLHLGYIPEPYTIYNEIQKFPSGSYSTITKTNQLNEKYWKPEEKISDTTISDYTFAKNKLNELLNDSIKYRMISDVPLGTFLSGGIDSSLVTAIAQKNSTSPVNTFSIGFKEAKFNESSYASNVAKFLKTNHHEFILSEKEAIESLEKIMDHFDEPFADTSALPTWMVSKLASKEVKVVLTGDGGDELFMGYGAYNWADRLSKTKMPIVRSFLKQVLNASGKNRLKRVANLFDYDSKTDIRSHIFSQEQCFFSEKQLNEISKDSIKTISANWGIIDSTARKLSPKEQQALFDIKYYLKDDLLVKVDRASMLASIEAREPLLDYKLVEFALNLDESLKNKKGISKLLLKDVLYDYIPASYFDRPKWGFSIPLAKWMKNDLSYLINDYLSPEITEQIGILNYDYIKTLKKRFYKGDDYLCNRLWAVIILHKWFIKNT